jgi:predicted nuclease of predicted toxin-antitoxin system
MRFLFDQSADRRLAAYLRSLGHDVTVVAVDYPPSIPDIEVLAIAVDEDRILVAEDFDFGELIFRHGYPHRGVILLRLPPMELETKIARLAVLLEQYSDQLRGFVVVHPNRIRVRRTTRRPSAG